MDSLHERTTSRPIQNGQTAIRPTVNSQARNFFRRPDNVTCEYIPQKFGYIFRPKTWWELVQFGGILGGVEFAYADEAACVTPILLSLGLKIKYITLIWCFSGLVGFFVNPVLGSLSDSCGSRLGRRRPFILLHSVGIVLGLIFVAHGHRMGIALGDKPNKQPTLSSSEVFTGTLLTNMSTTYYTKASVQESIESILRTVKHRNNNGNSTGELDSSLNISFPTGNEYTNYPDILTYFVEKGNTTSEMYPSNNSGQSDLQLRSIVITVVGAVLVDFCLDACQSPARSYLLDVTLPKDYASGLSTFTVASGFLGAIGYLISAVRWEETYSLNDQVDVVYTIVIIGFIICVIIPACNFPEIPLSLLKDPMIFKEFQQKLQEANEENELKAVDYNSTNYGTIQHSGVNMEDSVDPPVSETIFHISGSENNKDDENINAVPNQTEAKMSIQTDPTIRQHPTFKEYFKSIIRMPKFLFILCLTHLLSWVSFLCYVLYFTDFVGEVVYGGNPQASEQSESYKLYNAGVRFGSWGLVFFSLSATVYSYFIESLVKKVGAKTVYIGGQLLYCVGMILIAVTQHPVSVILLSSTAGVMFSTFFTMPFLLVGRYHYKLKFQDDKNGNQDGVRGIGTDVATVIGIVFLPQSIMMLSMGSIIEAVGSPVATLYAAAILSFCGAVSATQVLYLDI